MVAGPVGGEGDGRRHDHAHEQRRGGDDGDLAWRSAPSSRARPAGRAGCVPATTQTAANSSETRSGKAAPLALGASRRRSCRLALLLDDLGEQRGIDIAARQHGGDRLALAAAACRPGWRPATPRRPAPARASARGRRSARPPWPPRPSPAEPPARLRLATSKVSSPGVTDSSASQMEPDSSALRSRSPLLERAREIVEARRLDAVDLRRRALLLDGDRHAADRARRPMRPTSTMSGTAPIASACSIISRPAVPWPAITSRSSKGCT